MTVSFRSSLTDYWHQMSYLTTRTIAGRCFLAVYVIFPFIGPSVALYHTTPNSTAEHTMRLLFLPAVGATYLFFVVAMTLGTVIAVAIEPKATVTIEREFCLRKSLISVKSPWRRFAKLTEEPDYFHFVGWRCHSYIPKSAFDSRAEADAFYQTALQFWREAKGLPEPPIPSTVGVWPPAPRPSNSAEPGDGREG